MQLYLALVLYFVTFSQAVLVVDPVNGSDASSSGPFKTIKGAISYNSGSVLELQLLPGVYNVTSALTLSSANYTVVRFTAVDTTNTIIRCTSTGYRALIFTAVDAVELYGITFTNCADSVSGTGGGVVFGTIGSTFNITACKFVSNTGKKGGALSVATTSNPASSLIIHDSVFDSNTAASSSGGALFLSMINTDIKNTNFTNNVAFSNGGAMNIYWESTGYNYNVSLNGCTITGNKANTGGGGIATYNPNSSQLLGLSVINSVISGNTVNTTTSCQGGGIYFYQGAFLKVVGSTISDNHAIKPSTSGVFTQGGGIYTAFTQNTGTLEVDGSTIESNSADLGGGIMITNRFGKHEPQHSVKNSFIRFNHGNSNHGALVSTNCSVLLESSTFENNTVAAGGAIVVVQNNGIAELRSSIIRNNNSTGFSCQSSTTNFYQSSVYDNTIDFGCTATCTIIGFEYNFCNETCAYRDICSACNGDLSLTCAAQCDNDTWTSRESECPVTTTEGVTSTSSSDITSTSTSTTSSSTSSSTSSATSSTTSSTTSSSTSSSATTSSSTSSSVSGSTSSSTSSSDSTTSDSASSTSSSTSSSSTTGSNNQQQQVAFSFQSTEQITADDFKTKMGSILDVDPNNIVIVNFTSESAKRDFVTQVTFYILGDSSNAKVDLLEELVATNDASLTDAGFENTAVVVTTPSGTTTGTTGSDVSSSSVIVCNLVLLFAFLVLTQ